MDVSFAPAPHPTDEVVEKNGARVFLDEPAAAYLSSKELDATLRNGTVDLTVRPRPWRPTAHLGRDASEP
jgi:Fe-S cluster assembly iron-binding protein IscA